MKIKIIANKPPNEKYSDITSYIGNEYIVNDNDIMKDMVYIEEIDCDIFKDEFIIVKEELNNTEYTRGYADGYEDGYKEANVLNKL